MKPRQLTFAREYRGYSQTELANKINGLSQSNLSKFEKGLGSLSIDIQNTIMSFLDFPKEFFESNINSTIENANYRKRSSISKSDILKIETRCRLIGFMIDNLSSILDWPEYKLYPLNVDEGYSPEIIAGYNRKLLGLKGNEPVKNIFTLLESNGIILYELDENPKFDGLSFFTDKGYPMIIINKNFPNDRKRFTIAHELGHLLMHNSDYPISEFRNKEDEANSFASEFLMPEVEIKNSLVGLKISDLYTLKQQWLTSMAAIARRAKDLKTINENKYKYFAIELSRSFNKNEPGIVPIDNPKSLMQAYNILAKELMYDKNEIAAAAYIPLNAIDEIFNFSDHVKLRILRN